MDTTTNTAAKSIRQARLAFARHVRGKAEERSAKGSARYQREGKALRQRIREAASLEALLELSAET